MKNLPNYTLLHDELRLKTSSNYYYQVQGQIHLCQKKNVSRNTIIAHYQIRVRIRNNTRTPGYIQKAKIRCKQEKNHKTSHPRLFFLIIKIITYGHLFALCKNDGSGVVIDTGRFCFPHVEFSYAIEFIYNGICTYPIGFVFENIILLGHYYR
ncbi:YqaJ domain-containing protein [Aphis craccivora]|uniref:YqaJ domain-containing protein n=1 Tax=Aphis craccivora TaxID=307492 RepID=A0A6G0Y2G2_APHCR|nr:YqaJ domain-containing protein [Aphis craccivora]